MHLLLLTAGLLSLATACILLLAGAMRVRRSPPQHVRHAAEGTLPSALSPLARQQAIATYQAIQSMDLEEDAPSPMPFIKRASRKTAPATPKIARMRWQQRQPAMSGR